MEKKKVRATRTNGRKDSNGVFKAGHNDRSFNLENAEHVDADRSKWNVYWDYLQGYNLADENGVRPERKYLFDEVEYHYYYEKFGDSIEAQNERHEKSRHTERIRSVRQIMEDSRTCPEETIYQLGTKDGYENPAVFAKVAAELFEVIQEKYGAHMQILDWALHMDEATPHIHERHVFFADDGYGMNFPKQEKACEALGFHPPKPDKKKSKTNNCKVSFDEEIRRLYIEIAEKYGVVIEKDPMTGKKHLEKNDFIIVKQEAEIERQKNQLEELTLKLNDIDTLAQEVAEKAYERACEVVTETARAETIRDDISTVESMRDRLTGENSSLTKGQKNFSKNILNRLVDVLSKKSREIAVTLSQKLLSPAIKKKNEKEVASVACASIKMKLAEMKEKADQKTDNHKQPRKTEREVR